MADIYGAISLAFGPTVGGGDFHAGTFGRLPGVFVRSSADVVTRFCNRGFPPARPLHLAMS